MAGRKNKKTREEKRADANKVKAEVKQHFNKYEEERIKAKKKPIPYVKEIGEALCKEITSTSRGLAYICANNKDKGFPHHSRVYEWLIEHEDFADMYRRAREIQSHFMADETLEIADDKSQDVMYDKNGNEVCNKEFVMRSDIRIKTRQWMASKINRKYYGDKDPDDKENKSEQTTVIVNYPGRDPHPSELEE